jgi:hypothetical protein
MDPTSQNRLSARFSGSGGPLSSPSVHRFMGIALGLLLVAQIVALVNHDSRSTATPGPSASVSTSCLPLPGRAATPTWFPKDLPLPAGSYATALSVQNDPRYQPYRQVIFAVKASMTDFLRFAIARWPEKGWLFGRGDVERGEADASFFRPNQGRNGAFRARTQFCDQSWTWLYLILDLRGAGAVPSFSAHPSGSPLPSSSR